MLNPIQLVGVDMTGCYLPM